ncbi:MAG: RNA polymerase sigma factor [Spirochaetales bacterium]|nr:RNA polymerase sigma factor [Spirochaetales bacterium]
MNKSVLSLKKRENNDDESRILAAIQETLNGNTQSFAIIVEKYTPILYSLSYKMIGYSSEAEDVVQEIFLKVFASLDKFKISSRFLPWIYTIAINYLRSYLKKRNKQRKIRLLYMDKDEAIDFPDHKQVDPEQLFLRKEAEQAAIKALGRLRPEYRDVFLLRSLEGLSVKEVSSILNIPEGTVKIHLHRAKKDLIKMLSDSDF